MRLGIPAFSLRTRMTAVVVLILFAAGILITYLNSITTERMLFLDAENSSELIAAEFNFATSTSPEVDTAILTGSARLALRLIPDAEFIGFFKRTSTDSIHLTAFAGKEPSSDERRFLRNVLLQRGAAKLPVSSIRTQSTLYSYSILKFGNNDSWGYAVTEITLEKVRQIVRRNQETGAIITLLISVSASILLLFAMRLTFLRQFEDLARAMRSAAGGNLDARFLPDSGLEFRTISKIFNSMMVDLKRAQEINRTKMLEKEEYNVRLQKEVDEATFELRDKSSELMKLQARLQSFESQVALGKVASKLAHEVGSPLNAIYGSVQLLLENDISSEIRRKLVVIQRQVENMIAIINQALQSRKSTLPEKQKIVLKNLIEETKSVMEPKLRGTSIDFEIQLDNPESALNADPVQIQQVLMNLLNNSIEAITSKRKSSIQNVIKLRVYEYVEGESRNIRFDISDTGGGVRPEIVTQLFVDFIESKKPNGNGIGLVICKEIVERHSGKIFLAESTDIGSKFSVLIPEAL